MLTEGDTEKFPPVVGETIASHSADRLPPRMTMPRLLATVFVTGAAVIVVEILGTRIIGPVFGVSLFVWCALLAVTLGSLATGYYAGGVLVDRRPTPSLLNLI